MPWVRRTRHLGLSAGVGSGAPRVVVHSYLTDERVRLSAEELESVLELPTSRWSWRADVATERFARDGIVVSDEAHEPFTSLRRRDEELTRAGWLPESLGYHLATRWDGVTVHRPSRDGQVKPLSARPSPPLPPFPERGGPRTHLPPVAIERAIEQVLANRRTVRHFDSDRHVDVTELASLLGSVWGARATSNVAPRDIALRKSSPSGGGLHPIEVYPIVRSVTGIEPGIYHYLAAQHELELVSATTPEGSRQLVERATAGQWFFADADVAFVLTARFARSFWKYRRHAKAYRTLLLDAGHLSQTFYLVCTELGLGPWVTAALDDAAIERALELDPMLEGVMAVCGCGWPSPGQGHLDPGFVALDEGDRSDGRLRSDGEA
jgi:putative peptide maturation dehydrogenase